eukprot:jgi/Tetstr1/429192/TSEL_019145.t1
MRPDEVAPGVSVSTIFADIDDFQSKLLACFHSNSNLPGVIMRYATALRIPPNHPHLPGTAIKLAQHLRRTFDLLPVHRRYDEFTVVGVIQACLPHSAQVALEAASRRADEPIDSYSTICRHLEAIALESIHPPSPPSHPHTRHPPAFLAMTAMTANAMAAAEWAHSIMKCSSTSEADKQAWRHTVAANKADKVNEITPESPAEPCVPVPAHDGASSSVPLTVESTHSLPSHELCRFLLATTDFAIPADMATAKLSAIENRAAIRKFYRRRPAPATKNQTCPPNGLPTRLYSL